MGAFGVHNLTMRVFRSGKISHTLKNGSKWMLSGHTISPCGSPVSFRSSINSHIVKKWVFERERERGGEGERVVPPPLTFRSSKISLGLNESYMNLQPNHAPPNSWYSSN